jgi:hypothetical protein
VARVLHVALNVHRPIAKSSGGLLLRLLQQRQEILLLGHQTHATPATTWQEQDDSNMIVGVITGWP